MQRSHIPFTDLSAMVMSCKIIVYHNQYVDIDAIYLRILKNAGI